METKVLLPCVTLFRRVLHTREALCNNS